MFMGIKFTAGRRSPAKYVYNHENKFKPALWNSSAEPLNLTDFKDIEIISASLGYAVVKCYFTDGTEALATVDTPMMSVLQQFVYNSRNTPEGQQPELPVNDAPAKAILIALGIILALFMLIIISYRF